MTRLAILIACIATLGKAAAQQPAPAVKGLAVHEWGVFEVSEDADFANAHVRAMWDGMPEFVYGHIRGRAVPQHWGAAEIRLRPIIFFHTDKPTMVRAKVDFPGGMAGVWYPATEKPAVYGNQKQPKVGDSLEWNLGVKDIPQGWRPKLPAPLTVPDKHWFARVRQVKSDEIFSRFSPNANDVEREKFIYYDGLFPQGKWLAIKVDDKNVALTSRVKHPVHDVTVVDRRGDQVRVGRVAKLDAGATIKDVAFVEAVPSKFASEAADTLLNQLVAAGLFADEARSLVDLWRKELFETPGLSLFYRLPQSEYDARMPLTITPRPESMARVALIHHAHLEPDFAEQVLELVKQLDSPKFATREAALKKLTAIGPAALVQLQRLRERKDLSAEVRERLDALVKKFSAKDAFER
jgi:hypothetical protein